MINGRGTIQSKSIEYVGDIFQLNRIWLLAIIDLPIGIIDSISIS